MHSRRDLGQWGEDRAVEHLRRAGYTIVDRNVRSGLGEIDIVARDGGCLVFVEVRTRRSSQMAPEESVGVLKQERLARLGADYLAKSGIPDAEWRVDVVAIEQNTAGDLVRLEHFVSAVEDLS
ncbi:MAG: YraN family protein [Chloroflexi bacterium]|nr:YraN family protein [Chloroflexota bacterium]